MKEREPKEQLSPSEKRKRLLLIHVRRKLGNGIRAEIAVQILRGLMQ